MNLTTSCIEASLENGAAVSKIWHYGNAMGGVKLFVDESDAQRARALLV